MHSNGGETDDDDDDDDGKGDDDDDDSTEPSLDNLLIIMIIIIGAVVLGGFFAIRARSKKEKIISLPKKTLPEMKPLETGKILVPAKAKKIKKEDGRDDKKELTSEEREELAKTEKEVGVEEKEFICVVHKGPIVGNVYICPNCRTFYCVKCATALKEKGEHCWSCEKEIQL